MKNQKTGMLYHYTFTLFGSNEYMRGYIAALMNCICRDEPAPQFGYGIVEELGVEPMDGKVKTVCTMHVDTSKNSAERFIDTVNRMYKKKAEFHMEAKSKIIMEDEG